MQQGPIKVLLTIMSLVVAVHSTVSLSAPDLLENIGFFNADSTLLPSQIDVIINGKKTKLTPVKILGAGGFSKILLVKDATTNQTMAFSLLRPSKAGQSAYGNHNDLFRNEKFQNATYLSPVSVIDSGTIVINNETYHISFAHLSPLYAASAGSLIKNELAELDLLSQLKFAKLLLTQAMSGLEELNDLNYGHGDIKPDNILLTGNIRDFLAGKAKSIIIDFDLIKRLGIAYDNISGSPQYIAPEHFGQISNIDWRLADLYSLGHSIYTVIFGESLLKSLGKTTTAAAIKFFLDPTQNSGEMATQLRNQVDNYKSKITSTQMSESDRAAAVSLLTELETSIGTLISINPNARAAAITPINPAYAEKLKTPIPAPNIPPSDRACALTKYIAEPLTTLTETLIWAL